VGVCYVDYNPQDIKANPRQPQLFQKIMQGLATADEVKEFGELWQSRVEKIFQNVDSVLTISWLVSILLYTLV